MRDPLEAQPWTFGGSYSPDAIDDSSAVGRLSERIELTNQVKDLAKLLSLSVDAVGWEEPFGRGFARGSLWELYAEGHAGACLLFDGDRLIEVLMPQLEAHGDAFHEFLADRPRCVETLRRIRRGHAYVDDRELGLVLANELDELVCVSGLRDDPEVGSLEQAGEPLAQKDVVVRQDHPGGFHGPPVAILTTVGSPRLPSSSG
jgi:hypothetical protein